LVKHDDPRLASLTSMVCSSGVPTPTRVLNSLRVLALVHQCLVAHGVFPRLPGSQQPRDIAPIPDPPLISVGRCFSSKTPGIALRTPRGFVLYSSLAQVLDLPKTVPGAVRGVSPRRAPEKGRLRLTSPPGVRTRELFLSYKSSGTPESVPICFSRVSRTGFTYPVEVALLPAQRLHACSEVVPALSVPSLISKYDSPAFDVPCPSDEGRIGISRTPKSPFF